MIEKVVSNSKGIEENRVENTVKDIANVFRITLKRHSSLYEF